MLLFKLFCNIPKDSFAGKIVALLWAVSEVLGDTFLWRS